MANTKNKKYMFAEFKSQEEYQNAYKSVMDNTITNSQFELVIFIERLRTTLIQESICDVCQMEYPHLEENKTERK